MKEKEASPESETNSSGVKRLIGTVDQDYFDLPDAKRLKQLKAKGEEEFFQRAVKVIDDNLSREIIDLNTNIEEIDESILKVQQSLHTIRYHASLNIYAFEKFQSNTTKATTKSSLNHPTLKRHLGHQSFSIESIPTSLRLSEKPHSINKPKGKLNDGSNEANSEISTETTTDTKKSNVSSNPFVAPHQNPTIISQRRRERFQNKINFIVGNTYQYLKDGTVTDSSMKFKWRAYVRAADNNVSIDELIASVKFTLDKSYIPYNEVTVRDPPFAMYRRGWGEFKLFVQIMFRDPRNKPIHLIHPLTLSRVGDPLAFTGLWRLGKEQPFEISLYDKASDQPQPSLPDPITEPLKEINEESLEPKLIERRLPSEIIYKDEEGNITLSHSSEDHKFSSVEAHDHISDKVMDDSTVGVCSSTQMCSQEVNEMYDSKPINETNWEEPLAQIFVKKEDGTIVPKKIPKSLYDIAFKHASKNTFKIDAETLRLNTGISPQDTNINSPVITYCTLDKELVNRYICPQLRSRQPQSHPVLAQHSQSPPVLQTHGQLVTLPKFNNLSSPISTTVKVKSVRLPSPSTPRLNLPQTVNKVTLPQNNSQCPENKSNFKILSVKTLSSNPITLNPELLRKVDSNKFILKVNNLSSKQTNTVNSQTNLSKESQPLPLTPNNQITFNTSIKFWSEQNILNSNSQRESNPTSRLSLQSTDGQNIFQTIEPDKAGQRNAILTPSPIIHKQEKVITNSLEATDVNKTCIKNNKNENSADDKDLSFLEWLENTKLMLRARCKMCISVEEVLRIYLKGIPLTKYLGLKSSANEGSTRGPSQGRRKAMEFYRAREILKELRLLQVKDCQAWNSVKIVSFARSHGYGFGDAELGLKGNTETGMTTQMDPFTPYSDSEDEDVEKADEKANLDDSIEDDVEVEVVDEKRQLDREQEDASDKEDIIILAPPEMVEENCFVDEVLSKVRNQFKPEEIVPGVKMDVAKNMVYKAAMSFMEDLIRSSYAVAGADVPSKQEVKDSKATLESEKLSKEEVVIEQKHVLSVLERDRSGFKSLTRFGIGKKFIPWS